MKKKYLSLCLSVGRLFLVSLVYLETQKLWKKPLVDERKRRGMAWMALKPVFRAFEKRSQPSFDFFFLLFDTHSQQHENFTVPFSHLNKQWSSTLLFLFLPSFLFAFFYFLHSLILFFCLQNEDILVFLIYFCNEKRNEINKWSINNYYEANLKKKKLFTYLKY